MIVSLLVGLIFYFNPCGYLLPHKMTSQEMEAQRNGEMIPRLKAHTTLTEHLNSNPVSM